MGEFHYADILIAPVISERTNELMVAENKYVFLIARGATKHDVKRAVAERFKVQVLDVNIINLPRKPKRGGRRGQPIVTKIRRKAIVSLAEGSTIADLREAV